jgi:hypothetical protein
MRRVLAAFTVIVLATLASSDPLLCPDGCAEEPQQKASTPSPEHADCLACRNALSTALPTFDLTPGGLTEPRSHRLPALTPDWTPFPIDHPPRDA